jgi:hypothetical protein
MADKAELLGNILNHWLHAFELLPALYVVKGLENETTTKNAVIGASKLAFCTWAIAIVILFAVR